MVLRPPADPRTFEQAPPGGPGHRRRGVWLPVGLLAVLAIGIVLGRLTAPSSPLPPAVAVVVDDQASGHTRLAADVPVGYAHTEQGAASAATNYLASLAKATVSSQRTRHQMIAVLAAAGSRTALQEQYDWASAEVGRDLHLEGAELAQGVVRMVPVGWQLTRYDGRTAEVLVWGTGLYGSSAGVPVRETWGVNTVTLTWENGDWKLVSSRSEPAIVPLADPRSRVASDNGAGLAPLANRFQEYRYGS